MYDYLIVGAGLYGAVCAYELNKKGYKCIVVDKRNHVAGNIYTKNIAEITPKNSIIIRVKITTVLKANKNGY